VSSFPYLDVDDPSMNALNVRQVSKEWGVTFDVTKSTLDWLNDSFAKIVVGCSSEDEPLAIYAKAEEAKLPCSLIKDNGKTEFAGIPTFTAVAVGPGPVEDIDKITGHLKLL